AGNVVLAQNGNDGNDTITGPGTMSGNAGNDLLHPNSSAASDTVNGGDGDDSIFFDAGPNIVDGGLGFDKIIVVGNDEPNVVTTPTVLGPSLQVNQDGVIGTYPHPLGDAPTGVEQLLIQSLGGDDVINVTHVGSFLPGLPTRVEAGDGNDTVTGSAAPL